MPKIIHYRDNCIGCNSCVEQCPAYWEISKEDGKATLKRSSKKKDVHILDVHKDEIQENQKAADACPVRIIRLS